MARVSPSTTRSRTRTMLGWSSANKIERSWTKRVTTSGSSPSSGRRIFTATASPVTRLWPRHTSPIAPRPNRSTSTYIEPNARSATTPPGPHPRHRPEH